VNPKALKPDYGLFITLLHATCKRTFNFEEIEVFTLALMPELCKILLNAGVNIHSIDTFDSNSLCMICCACVG